jgi:hypothetical protein
MPLAWAVLREIKLRMTRNNGTARALFGGGPGSAGLRRRRPPSRAQISFRTYCRITQRDIAAARRSQHIEAKRFPGAGPRARPRQNI